MSARNGEKARAAINRKKRIVMREKSRAARAAAMGKSAPAAKPAK